MLAERPDGEAAVGEEVGERASAASVVRQLPGADAQSESWSSTVPPSSRPAATSAHTVSGVASARQSLPHALHSTVRMPSRRAVIRPSGESAPCGGR